MGQSSFAQAEDNLKTNPSTLEAKFIRHFQHLFDVKGVEGIFPRLNTVYQEVSEVKNFLNTLRSVLNLPDSAPVNKCFEELQALVAGQDKSRAHNHEYNLVEQAANSWKTIVFRLQELLHCTEEQIVDRVKEWQERCTNYDDVFPRVHDLVTNLRSVLGVDHT